MPLKHRTETLFVVLLAVIIMVTGFVLASLPPLPQGSIPWAIVFVLTLLYPAVLMPFYRRERADHEFRSLHWFPMTMTLVWLMFALLAWFVPATRIALSAYTWAWLLPMVSFAVLGLLLFCSKVIRQWAKRTVLVLLAFVPFAALALWSSTGPHFERTVADSLWNGSLFATTNPTPDDPVVAKEDENEPEMPDTIALEDTSSSAMLDSSSSEAVSSSSTLTDTEQQWQDFLTDYQASSQSSMQDSSSSESSAEVASASSEEESRNGILGFFGFGNDSSAPPMFADEEPMQEEPTEMTSSSASSSPLLIGQNSSVPSHLPNSGFGWSLIIVSLLALYSAVLHKRQLKLA